MAIDLEDDVAAECDDELPPAPGVPVVGGYDQLVEIGRGGTGVVYRARHLRLGRWVALKFLRSGPLSRPDERDRLLREARAAAALQHPNILQVFEVGEHAGGPYLALEYVAGGTLQDRLARGPMPPLEAAALVETLAQAVQHAHDHGVVHRDLKPANVLMGGGQWAADSEARNVAAVVPIMKIADFGLARVLTEDPGATKSGTILGTPSYMAPEQIAGRPHDIGIGADVYALGAILYACVTGRPPFQAATMWDTLHLVETAEPLALSRVQPATPRDLSTICLTCLQKAAGQRYGAANDLAADLRRFLDGQPIMARPVGVAGRLWRWARRSPKVAALLAALAVTLTAGVVGILGQWRRAESLYDTAERQRTKAEDNLARYQQAADDFTGLFDSLDTDQLFHLRQAQLRPELLLPALEKNRAIIASIGDDPERRAEAVRADFRIAILTRMLIDPHRPESRAQAIAAGRRALAELEAFAGPRSNVVQYRRDRAALLQSLGFLLNVGEGSAEALSLLEVARQLRQELLDAQPDHLDYRSELAGCWNDSSLILRLLKRYDDSLAGLDRAIELQAAVVAAAPQVPRYRKFLANHHFNRGMTLLELKRAADAADAGRAACQLFPHDADQWLRSARILARASTLAPDSTFADEAIAAIRRAMGLGPTLPLQWLDYEELNVLRERSEFQALVDAAKRANAARQ